MKSKRKSENILSQIKWKYNFQKNQRNQELHFWKDKYTHILSCLILEQSGPFNSMMAMRSEEAAEEKFQASRGS